MNTRQRSVRNLPPLIKRLLCVVAGLTLLYALLAARVAEAGFPAAPLLASPKQLALTVADVSALYGSGFAKTHSKSALNIAGSSVAAIRGKCLSGYGEAFQRSDGKILVNLVVLCSSSSVARQAVRNVLHTQSVNAGGFTGRAAAVKGVGDAAARVTVDMPTAYPGVQSHLLELTYSRGRYAVVVAEIEVRSRVDLARVLALGKIVDQRIVQQGTYQAAAGGSPRMVHQICCCRWWGSYAIPAERDGSSA